MRLQAGDAAYYLVVDTTGTEYFVLRGEVVARSRNGWVTIKRKGHTFRCRDSAFVGHDAREVWRKAISHVVGNAFLDGFNWGASGAYESCEDCLGEVRQLLVGFERWVRCQSDGTVSQQPRVLSTGGP